MAEGRKNAVLLQLFWILFGLAFLSALAAALLGGGAAAALCLPPCAVLLWGIWRLAHWQRLREGWLLAAFGLFFIAFVALQMNVAVNRYFVPTSSGDLEAVYTGVRELVENGRLTDSTLYFLRHEHQVFVLVALYAFVHLTLLLGGTTALPYAAFGVLAAVGVSAAVLLLAAAVGLCRGRRTALAVGFGLLLLSPLVNGVTYAYTHVLGYPFLYGALFLFVLAQKKERVGARLALLGAAGAVLALGCLMSGAMNVVLVAFLLALLMRGRLRQALAGGAVLLAAFLLMSGAFRLFWAHSGWIDRTRYEEEHIPLTHWVMIGLNEEGLYSEEDLEATVAIRGSDAKLRFNLEQISERLKAMGPGGFVVHLWGKVRATWRGMPFGTAVWPGLPGRLLQHGLMAALLALSLAGAAKAFFAPQAGLHFLCALVLLGLFILLLIWETHNRYIYPYLPLLLPCAMAGAKALDGWGRTIWRRAGRAVVSPD